MEETVFEMQYRRRQPHRRRRPRRRKARGVILALTALVVLAAALLWLNRDRSLPGEGVTLPDYVQKDLLPVNPWSRPGTPLEKIDGVVIHYVGNPDTTAQANRNYFASLASGEEGTYASNERNEDTIAIEVCHPDETGEFSDVTYWRTVELTAWLCNTFHLDPEKDVIRHYDVTGKRCPLYYVEHPEAWEDFLVDVAAEVEVQAAEEEVS